VRHRRKRHPPGRGAAGARERAPSTWTRRGASGNFRPMTALRRRRVPRPPARRWSRAG